MSLATNLTDLATRIATETKTLRTLINGNALDLSALTTTAKGNLVLALNEVDAAVDALAGAATTLDGLSDVAITTPAAGHVVRHNGTTWVNALGTTHFETAGAAAAAQAASQPLDSDLTAIAALSTTAFGRALLTQVSAATLTAALNNATELLPGIVELATTAEAVAGVDTTRAVTSAGVAARVNAVIDAAPGALDTLNELAAALGDDPNFASTMTTALADKQPLDTDLTAIAALTTTAYGRAFLSLANQAALVALLPAYQPLDTDLTAIAGLVSAADRLPYFTGAGTAGLATFTAAGRALMDDASVAAQRTTLDVFSKVEIGSVTTDFVATFNAGLI